ncbi:SDR family NAD(P)-dependent oxidoreductase [Sulfidibacter corallicola]|uniref:Phenolphthiocerol/phthiocerol polyketide synthase subunit E n=1 Tax=Sulfidibacter corallicola TaxID=2818388 RepID=A0A8A4TT49_SULCO|nr:type I polyketide synthase [Sulfidibacter corallicola]QTD52258.1 SDR family NAD(P)-dependent oxidoreductase [Sulfidibacter corallicola]
MMKRRDNPAELATAGNQQQTSQASPFGSPSLHSFSPFSSPDSPVPDADKTTCDNASPATCSPSDLCARLRRHPTVRDAVALELTGSEGGRSGALICYVPERPLAPERVRLWLAESGVDFGDGTRIGFLPVRALPYGEDGLPDRERLRGLIHVDETLCGQWETRLHEVPGVARVAVLPQAPPAEPEVLRWREVLPEAWRTPLMSLSGEQDGGPVRDANADSGEGVPAHSIGDPLRRQPDDPHTLIEALTRTVARSPQSGLIAISEQDGRSELSYADLHQKARRVATGLAARGLEPGTHVLFQFDHPRAFITAFWGCVWGGFVPVPLPVAPSYAQANPVLARLHHAWNWLDRPPVLSQGTVADAIEDQIRRVAPREAGTADFSEMRLFRLEEWVDGDAAGEPPTEPFPAEPDRTALLLLTSGSTGVPKGVPLTHANLLAMSAGTAQMNDFDHDDVTLNWMPLDHVGATVFLSIMPVHLGCRQIHIPSDLILKQPLRWLELISELRVSITWAPNFAFSLIADQAEAVAAMDLDLSSMGFLVNAGELVVASTARRFLELLQPHGLPQDALRPAFGMSETCSGITWSAGLTVAELERDLTFVPLGRPIPGAEIRVVDGTGRLSTERTIGQVHLRGPSVFAGYHRNPERNAACMQDGWFNTGDLGYLDEGRLVITGREKDEIIINGANFYCHEIEAAVEEVPGVAVSFTAACGVREPGAGTDRLAIFFNTPYCRDPQRGELAPNGPVRGLIRKIRGHLARKVGVQADFLIPVAQNRIPKTGIGKIQRSQLKQVLLEGGFDQQILAQAQLPPGGTAVPKHTLTRVWRPRRPFAEPPRVDFSDRLMFAPDRATAEAWCGPTAAGSILVSPGDGFARIDERHYRVRPDRPEDFIHLLNEGTVAEAALRGTMFLWQADEVAEGTGSSARDLGGALLWLSQAMAERFDDDRRLRLMVGTRAALTATDGDRPVPERAMIAGLTAALVHEPVPLDLCLLDVDRPDSGITAGLFADEGPEREWALRQGVLSIPCLAPVDAVSTGALDQARLPFKRGGRYLITGGLGRIGALFASWLGRVMDARMLLIGRTRLDGADPPREEEVRTKLQRLNRLRRADLDACYRQVDVCDGPGLRRAIDECEAHWGGALDGVVHLAGVFRERSVGDEEPESFKAALAAKTTGTRVVYDLVADRPDACFVGLGSVLGFLGAPNTAAFAAAARFMDAFARERDPRKGPRRQVLSLAAWDFDDVGGNESAARARGLLRLAPRWGMAGLLRALCRDEDRLLLGLDPSAAALAPLLAEADPGAPQPTAYLSFDPERATGAASAVARLSQRDLFGRAHHCRPEPLIAMPMEEHGRIDRALLSGGGAATASERGRGEVASRIAAIWEQVLGLTGIGAHDNFFELGGHSLLLTQVQTRLQEAFGRNLSVVDMFQHPTIADLARFLGDETGGAHEPAIAEALVQAGKRRREARSTDIAVIGLACRFPGAESVEDFWRNLHDGVCSVTQLSESGLAESGIDPVSWQDPAYVRAAPIMAGAAEFDADLFGFSRREAELLDPQQRVLLQCAWSCLEHAGHRPRVHGGKIGLYAGAGMNTYLLNNVWPNRHRLDPRDSLDVATLDSYGGFQLMVANDKDYLTTRISYKLNLRGPSVNVQTACSTSLVAVHMACQSLIAGECEMALAGGVSVTSPECAGHLHQEGMITSPDGLCRAFDARAEGTVFGSGAGMVLLKPLAAALADGDRVYAVVKGSATNNDGGTKVGYMAPAADGQASAVAEALAVADVDPATVGYVEMHGTGTVMGDPIEIDGVTRGFRTATDQRGYCAIGSVKTNVGHLQIASGIAGFIKTVLCLHYRQLPANLHYERPNPAIDFEATPFYVNDRLCDWRSERGPLRAGVNSLGIGGSNCHVILEQAPDAEARDDRQPHTAQLPADRANRFEQPRHLLQLSARDDQALRRTAERYVAFLRREDAPSPSEICYTAATGREPMAHRLAVHGRDHAELADGLDAWLRREPVACLHTGHDSDPRKLAMLFSGQGDAYPGMGRNLYRSHPVFREALDRRADILRDHLDVPLTDILFPDEGSAVERLVEDTTYAQPALVALQLALVDLWRAWGIRPAVVMGHSLGEFSAAMVAGLFSEEQGLPLVVQRARLMGSLPRDGYMVSVALDESRAREAIDAFTDRLSVAVINGPNRSVLSGERAALARVERELAEAGVQVTRLQTSHAFHSPAMEPALDAFRDSLRRIDFRTPTLDAVINLDGAPADDRWGTPEYWVRHLRRPVRFADGLRSVHAKGCRALLEIGPHRTLLGLAAGNLPGDDLIMASSLQRGVDDWTAALDGAARLVAGRLEGDEGELDLENVARTVDPQMSPKRVALPTYPFARTRCWLEPPPRGRTQTTRTRGLLGEPVRLPGLKQRVFESDLSLQDLPLMGDHRIFDVPVVSAACHVATALAADRAISPGSSRDLREIHFAHPLILPETGGRRVQLICEPEARGETAFQLLHFDPDDPNEVSRIHATGVFASAAGTASPIDAVEDWPSARDACPTPHDVDRYYGDQAERRIDLGLAYRWFETLQLGEGRAACRLRVPTRLGGLPEEAHPGLVDACFGLLLAAVGPSTHTWMPFAIERVQVLARLTGAGAWGYLSLRPDADGSSGRLVGDARLFDGNGRMMLAITGLEAREASVASMDRPTAVTSSPHTYSVAWQPVTPPAASPSGGLWLIFEDEDGELAELREALRAHGTRVVTVCEGLSFECLGEDRFAIPADGRADFARLMNALPGESRLERVLYGWALDEPLVPASSPEARFRGCRGLLQLTRALIERNGPQPPRLTVLTRAAGPVAADGSFALNQTPLSGMALAIALEHPELHCAWLDLDGATAPDRLLPALRLGDEEPRLMLRDGRFLVARLQHDVVSLPDSPASLPIREDAAYLITGGTGGLGLALMEHLAARGARRLVLVGRGRPHDEAAARIEALSAQGVDVTAAQADVRDGAAMASLIQSLRTEARPLRGLIHAAGFLRDRMIADMDWEQFRGVFETKALGAWTCHEACRDLELDFFVMFSSAASVLGNQGQANYAAGNAYLDGLAHYRRSMGLPALSINWGPWQEVGIAAVDHGIRPEMARQGFRGLPPRDGFAVFDALLADPPAQVAVVDCDWDRYLQANPPAGALLRDLTAPAPESAVSPSRFVAELAALDAEARADLLKDRIAAVAGQVLSFGGHVRLDPDRPLTEQGLDSLSAVQFRNSLGRELGRTLPVSLVYNHPTLNRITRFLLDEVLDASATASEPLRSDRPPVADTARAVLAEIEDLLD